MTDERTPAPLVRAPLRAERFKAFVDAVVAIAMTLLILPLLESVSEAATDDLSTAAFLAQHAGQLMSFGLSFVLIATFWMEHHRVYSRVETLTPALLWLNVLWMVTIVWLPVPTAMLGQMTNDPLQAVVYIGTLTMTQVATLLAKVYLSRHPALHSYPEGALRDGALGDVASTILFLIALPIAAWVHPLGYFALLLVSFTAPVARILKRLHR